jgi:hypothetical protein
VLLDYVEVYEDRPRANVERVADCFANEVEGVGEIVGNFDELLRVIYGRRDCELLHVGSPPNGIALSRAGPDDSITVFGITCLKW